MMVQGKGRGMEAECSTLRHGGDQILHAPQLQLTQITEQCRAEQSGTEHTDRTPSRDGAGKR